MAPGEVSGLKNGEHAMQQLEVWGALKLPAGPSPAVNSMVMHFSSKMLHLAKLQQLLMLPVALY